MTKCKACGAEIKWIKTLSGKFTPVNPDESSHWATCPSSGHFKSTNNLKKVKVTISLANAPQAHIEEVVEVLRDTISEVLQKYNIKVSAEVEQIRGV